MYGFFWVAKDDRYTRIAYNKKAKRRSRREYRKVWVGMSRFELGRE